MRQRATNVFLRKQVKMPEPGRVSFERLVDWVEGRLTEEQARAVERQVAVADEVTRAEVEWLRTFARLSEDVVLDAPPPEVRGELIRRFEVYARDRREPGLLRRLVATLTFDGGLQPAVAGIRSAGAQEKQRQLVYATDAADVALNIWWRPHDGRLDLVGQVFPTDESRQTCFGVQLLSDAREVGIATTNELGEFSFESVPSGVYEVLLSGEGIEIRIPRVELRR